MATEERTWLRLQENVGYGRWRSLMDFEESDFRSVLVLAEKLFELGDTCSTKGIQLRILCDGRVACNWCKNKGWKLANEVPA